MDGETCSRNVKRNRMYKEEENSTMHNVYAISKC